MNLVSDSRCFRTYLLHRSKIKRPPFWVEHVQIVHLECCEIHVWKLTRVKVLKWNFLLNLTKQECGRFFINFLSIFSDG